MRVGAGAPVHTLVFNVEEALRLCSLPGESEGKVYFFQRVHVGGLPENGDRRTWLEAFQNALLDLARSAVYGRHPSAPKAGAIYFLSQREACEWLMNSLLQRRTVDAWFWPAISGADAADDVSVQIAGAIERLSSSAASWMAVAAAVFALGDPVSLLGLLPESAVRRWLWEIGSAEATAATRLSVRVAGTALKSITRAAAVWGREDPRVVWLTSLAVIINRPVAMGEGTAVRSARMILQTMPEPGFRKGSDLPLSAPEIAGKRFEPPVLRNDCAPDHQPAPAAISQDPSPEVKSFGNQCGTSGPGNPPPSERTVHSDSQLPKDATHPISPAGSTDKPARSWSSTADADSTSPEGGGAQPGELAQGQPALSGTLSDAVPPTEFGEMTQGAGLFFLLNALRYLGIEDANVTQAFLAHLFLHLARRAGIDDHDPILLWTQLTLADDDAVQVNQRQVRIWAWKLRRWCWKNASISAVDVVRRSGIVTLTRTDLDVSLSIDSADIRIRRAGLDLDPGWLPWFGRVVRFHYRYRGDLQ